MATHSNVLAWKIPWIEESGRVNPWGHKESDMSEHRTRFVEGDHQGNRVAFELLTTLVINRLKALIVPLSWSHES